MSRAAQQVDAERQAWLDQVVEAAIDSDIDICDAHHHLWELPGSRYLLPQFRADSATGHRVEDSIYVECDWHYFERGPSSLRPVGETAHIASLALDTGVGRGTTVAAIVGFADLRLGAAVTEVLDAHLDAGRGLFRGIRHASAWDASPEIRNAHTDPGPGLLSRDDFVEGARSVAAANLSLDLWLYHPQLTDAVELARRVPDLRIVVDHLGGMLGIGPYAGRSDEILPEWQASMRELAQCPNVSIKLGGFGLTSAGCAWHRRTRPPTSEEIAAAWGEPVRWCIETFGVDRCMFESNFPVDRRSCSYVVLWNACKLMVAEFSLDERRQLLGGSARNFYRLNNSPAAASAPRGGRRASDHAGAG